MFGQHRLVQLVTSAYAAEEARHAGARDHRWRMTSPLPALLPLL